MLRCAITDRRLLAPDEPARRAALLRQAAQLARDGVDFLQLREKDLPPNELASLARELLGVLAQEAPDPAHRTRLLMNSRADVALAAGADGVHLTASPEELTPAQVRRLFADAGAPAPLISQSCHHLGDVERTQATPTGAPSLILFGPVFEKTIAGEPIAPGGGLELFRYACILAAPIPVLALGGVTLDNTADCLAAGAAGIAAIRMFLPG